MHLLPRKSAAGGLARRTAEALGLARPSGRDPLGEAGERVAAKHLARLGYRVIGRNLHVPMGEADLLAVAPDRETVVLVEVKSRRVEGSTQGDAGDSRHIVRTPQPPPEASITAHKRAKLVEILRHLARANGWGRRPLRIDAVAVEWPRDGEPVVRHHPGAVPIGAEGGRPS